LGCIQKSEGNDIFGLLIVTGNSGVWENSWGRKLTAMRPLMAERT